MTDWHGWSRGALALHIGQLPNRKRLALYTIDRRNGNVMYVHAYFRNLDEAERAMETLDHLMQPVGRPS